MVAIRVANRVSITICKPWNILEQWWRPGCGSQPWIATWNHQVSFLKKNRDPGVFYGCDFGFGFDRNLLKVSADSICIIYGICSICGIYAIYGIYRMRFMRYLQWPNRLADLECKTNTNVISVSKFYFLFTYTKLPIIKVGDPRTKIFIVLGILSLSI